MNNRYRYPTTNWALLAQAFPQGDTAQRQSFDTLVRLYLPAIHFHLRRSFRLSEELIEEFTQDFIERKLLNRNLFQAADPAKAKFRTLLARAVERYYIDWNKRRLKHHTSDLESVNAASGHSSPSTEFDRAWARNVLAIAIARCKTYCDQTEKQQLWLVFEHRLLAPAEQQIPPMPYAELATVAKLKSPTQASNLLVTAKRLFERVMKEVVAEYADSSDFEEELADLRRLLGNGK